MLRFFVFLYFEGKFTIYLVVVTDNESIDHIKKIDKHSICIKMLIRSLNIRHRFMMNIVTLNIVTTFMVYPCSAV